MEEAQKICRSLVEQKLIACANVLPPHTSIYRWNEAVQTELEVLAVIKTTSDKIEQIQLYIAANHSYTTPCAVFWPIEQGPDNFLNWVYKQTHD